MPRLHPILLLLALACTRAESAPADSSSSGAVAAAAGVVDSIIPRQEALRRFRADLDSAPAKLGRAAPSRDSLIAMFVSALQARDTATLGALVLDRGEFAWLYFPTAQLGLPPYSLSPALLWFQTQERNRQGLIRALERRGGRDLHVTGYRCDRENRREGENAIWGPCELLRRDTDGEPTSERLFGLIVERHGRWKFVSYANEL